VIGMRAVTITDRARLRSYFMRAPALHLYELGDLDDFFWPHTRWFAFDDGELEAVVLLYSASSLPVVLAIGDVGPLTALIASIHDELPARIYAHLSPGLVGAFGARYASEPHGDYVKMSLADRSALEGLDTSRVVPLASGDRDELAAFFARSYPSNWFDPRMLDTGQYAGIRDHELLAAGGVHVYSPAERVAALGNIAVAPEQRGRGLGTLVVAHVSRSLLAHVDHVGLNVRADNRAAIRCYEWLGFGEVGRYEEHLLTTRR